MEEIKPFINSASQTNETINDDRPPVLEIQENNFIVTEQQVKLDIF